MSNFSPKIEDANDEQLKHWLNESRPDYASLASDELTRRNLNALQHRMKILDETIKDLDKDASRYNNILTVLTISMFILALVQLVISFSNIWLRLIIMVPMLTLVGVALWVFSKK